MAFGTETLDRSRGGMWPWLGQRVTAVLVNDVPHHQLIVVGGGPAGLRAAVEARAAGIDVAILSQVVIADSDIQPAAALMPNPMS